MSLIKKGCDVMSLYGINAYTSNSNSLYSSLTSLLSGSGVVTSYNNKQSKNSTNNDMSEIVKQAAMVRSPSYQKKMLEELKKVFSGESTGEVGTVESEMKVSNNAKDLSKYAASLASNSFSTWTNKNDAVKNFVEQYNSEMESLAGSTEKADLGRQATLINNTKKYSSMLKRIGVTVGEDNKLSIDKSKLSVASDRDVRTLLSGDYSYASKIGMSASGISDSTKDTVKKFADSYNKTMDSLEKSDSANALQKGVSLVNITKAYSRTLARIGLRVGSDNRLTVDEDKLAKASEGDLKALFNGNYSYATKVADKASYISRAAGLSAQVSYNNKGQTNNIYDMLSNIMFNNKA